MEDKKKTRQEIAAEMKKARFDQPIVSSEEFAQQMESMIGSNGMRKSRKRSDSSKTGREKVIS
ncbi:MAG: hypothetical protein AAF226_03275 [Verrucomicrobiota bacterium]